MTTKLEIINKKIIFFFALVFKTSITKLPQATIQFLLYVMIMVREHK